MSEMSYLPPQPPPPPPPPAAPETAPQFDFAKPFTYVFEDPRWMQKILIGGLFYLASIFIIGLFFVMGYMARVVRNVIAGVERPLPEWEDVGSFLGDGLRLVGVAAVYILPFIVVTVMVMVPLGFLGALENDGLSALGSGLTGCVACLMFPLSLLVMFFLPGSLLFAAAEQRFSAGFEFGRIWPFIKANFANYLLAVVVYLIARFVGGLGVFLLCVGVIFTAFWAFLITAHAFGQVYRAARTR
jgi:hypothetical protein